MFSSYQVKSIRSGICDDKYILQTIPAKFFIVFGSIFKSECLFDRQAALTELRFLSDKKFFMLIEINRCWPS